MKTTIDIPDELYRRVKVKSAMEGRPVREVTVELFREWVSESRAGSRSDPRSEEARERRPAWFGSLRRYAANARGRHDMPSVRRSIARGRMRSGVREDGDE